MFDHLSLPLLLLIFAAAAGAVWVAGIYLSNTTDVLSERLHLGQALGGLILLAIATNLPEIAITWTAARSGDLSIAIGNILGGIAVQTLVLVVLDVFGVREKEPLTYQAASLGLVLEGVLVMAVLTVAVMGHELPASLIFARVTPGPLLIAVLWIVGVWLVGKARTDLPWHEKGNAPDSKGSHKQDSNDSPNVAAGSAEHPSPPPAKQQDKPGTGRAALVFGASALVTLAAGVVLEQSGDAIAGHIGMNGVLFGATILAAATSLPELSTGLTSVRQKDYQLAISDIFGGNAFLPVLFLMATLLSGQAVLPRAGKSDIYLAGLGILLTAVYVYGLIFRPKARVLRMGRDSLVVLILYALGVAGLFAISRGG